MPEPTPPTPAPTPPAGDNPPAPPANPTPPPTGDDPTPPEKVADVDFSKLSDGQLSKALEDPRFFNIPRIKALREKAAKADTLAKDKKDADEKELEAQNKHKELAEQRKTERDDWKNKHDQSVINNAIITEAAKVGITDLDAAKKLIDKANIKIDENGSLTGVAEAVAQLAKDKAYLVGTPKPPTDKGGGTNPPSDGGKTEFTMSQVKDPVFYAKNHEAIKRALAEGRVLMDQ